MVHEITNPFYQAKTGKNLRDRLEDLLGYHFTSIRLCHAVAFTGPTARRSVTEEAKPEIIIGRQDLGRLHERVREIIAHCMGRDLFLHGREIVEGLVRLLARTTTLPNPLRSQIEDEHGEIQTLTNSQIELFRRLQGTRRLAVGGGAGSGKTYVAVQRARDLARQGLRTLLVCHAAPLARHLRELTAGLDGLDAMTARELACRVRAGLDPDAADADETFPAKLHAAVATLPERPYRRLWWTRVRTSRPTGSSPLRRAWTAARGASSTCSTTRTTRPSSRAAGKSRRDLLAFGLEENVRNTQRICRAMQPYYHGGVAIAPLPTVAPLPPSRTPTRRRTRAEAGGVLAQLLVVENLLARDVVVLTPRDPLSSSELPKRPAAERHKAGDRPQQVLAARNVLLSSVADFKGLESSVVVVAELDEGLPGRPAAAGRTPVRGLLPAAEPAVPPRHPARARRSDLTSAPDREANYARRGVHPRDP